MADAKDRPDSLGDMHPAVLLRLLGGDRLCRIIVVFDSIDSTNGAAMRAAARGAKEGSVFIAEEQYRGRGRNGRTWHAAKSKDLAFSIVLRPDRDPTGLTSLLALAASQAIAQFTGSASIKWPNDIYVGGKKISGILAESKGGAVVLGIGVNVNESMSDLPIELRDSATSISMETGRRHERAEVLVSIVGSFEEAYPVWTRSGLGPFIGALEEIMIYIGERVFLERGQERIAGVVKGITAEGYLRLEVDGVEREFSSGDVSIGGWGG
jgi:BirA family biotin operon repressor/biotin-[acetyl-CoA-carboxylase] ligase